MSVHHFKIMNAPKLEWATFKNVVTTSETFIAGVLCKVLNSNAIGNYDVHRVIDKSKIQEWFRKWPGEAQKLSERGLEYS